MIRGRAGAAFFIRGCEWPKSARCGSLPAPGQVQVPGPGPGPSSKGRREGQEGAGGPSSAGKFSTCWVVGTYRCEAGEVFLQAELLCRKCAPARAAKYPAMSSNLRPSELEGRGKGTV